MDDLNEKIYRLQEEGMRQPMKPIAFEAVRQILTDVEAKKYEGDIEGKISWDIARIFYQNNIPIHQALDILTLTIKHMISFRDVFVAERNHSNNG